MRQQHSFALRPCTATLTVLPQIYSENSGTGEFWKFFRRDWHPDQVKRITPFPCLAKSHGRHIISFNLDEPAPRNKCYDLSTHAAIQLNVASRNASQLLLVHIHAFGSQRPKSLARLNSLANTLHPSLRRQLQWLAVSVSESINAPRDLLAKWKGKEQWWNKEMGRTSTDNHR
jgi:hypothetical protein